MSSADVESCPAEDVASAESTLAVTLCITVVAADMDNVVEASGKASVEDDDCSAVEIRPLVVLVLVSAATELPEETSCELATLVLVASVLVVVVVMVTSTDAGVTEEDGLLVASPYMVI